MHRPLLVYASQVSTSHEYGLFYRSLLQKSPIKETIVIMHCRCDADMWCIHQERPLCIYLCDVYMCCLHVCHVYMSCIHVYVVYTCVANTCGVYMCCIHMWCRHVMHTPTKAFTHVYTNSPCHVNTNKGLYGCISQRTIWLHVNIFKRSTFSKVSAIYIVHMLYAVCRATWGIASLCNV